MYTPSCSSYLRLFALRSSMACAVLLIGGWTTPCHAVDTPLGTLVSDSSVPASSGPTITNLRNPPVTTVYRTPDGHIYYKTDKGIISYPSSGTTTTYNPVGGGGAQTIIQPAPGTPPVSLFDQDVNNFITTQLATLPNSTPGVGTTFYSLTLPGSLQAEGSAGSLFGDSSASATTFSVTGFVASANQDAILGSSSSNGLTPVRFSYNPATLGLNLTLDFASGQFMFISGPTFNSTVTSTGYLVSSVPEPGPLSVLVGLGVFCAGFLSRRRQNANKVA